MFRARRRRDVGVNGAEAWVGVPEARCDLLEVLVFAIVGVDFTPMPVSDFTVALKRDASFRHKAERFADVAIFVEKHFDRRRVARMGGAAWRVSFYVRELARIPCLFHLCGINIGGVLRRMGRSTILPLHNSAPLSFATSLTMKRSMVRSPQANVLIVVS